MAAAVTTAAFVASALTISGLPYSTSTNNDRIVLEIPKLLYDSVCEAETPLIAHGRFLAGVDVPCGCAVSLSLQVQSALCDAPSDKYIRPHTLNLLCCWCAKTSTKEDGTLKRTRHITLTSLALLFKLTAKVLQLPCCVITATNPVDERSCSRYSVRVARRSSTTAARSSSEAPRGGR